MQEANLLMISEGEIASLKEVHLWASLDNNISKLKLIFKKKWNVILI
jgi:hypothetical protein